VLDGGSFNNIIVGLVLINDPFGINSAGQIVGQSVAFAANQFGGVSPVFHESIPLI
jgi:hypothetical protein